MDLNPPRSQGPIRRRCAWIRLVRAEPLLMGAIYWFVFTKIFERKIGGEPYIIFLLAAMLPWMWFSSGLTEGAKALRSQRRLVASTPLPRQIWVLR